ncbi:hypothetical protein GCK72_020442 [Caenorhabditis remanei]|uniref:Uncharacterized protein n=1 Tax=Caenorhabditis remanei TaxID=31234 RepID=A0A6A5GH36_CAERE|nr:hypothetical protein GCK72_020442 [Caenorhabditis remanei]KAF1753885.1 hypothetical protein GCK72_020442 [Caenorhabditis remanei]
MSSRSPSPPKITLQQDEMSESADHLLDELSKKLVDEAIPSAQHHLEQEEKETKSHQKTPPSSLNDSFADDVLDKETKLINTDDSSKPGSRKLEISILGNSNPDSGHSDNWTHTRSSNSGLQVVPVPT